MRPINTYVAGDAILLTYSLVNAVTNEPIDASTVSLKVRDPAGTVTTVTGDDISNPETGTYTYVFDTTGGVRGLWTYQWVSTGTGQAVSRVGDGYGQFQLLPLSI